ARPVGEPGDFPLRVVIAVTSVSGKPLGSTAAMQKTAETSPYYDAWLRTAAADLDAARSAIAGRDLAALGEVAEASCLKMHAAAAAARPGILYWTGPTVELIHRVRSLREGGQAAYFTIDAGPQVKVLCRPDDCATIAAQLAQVAGVVRTITCAPGKGVEILEA